MPISPPSHAGFRTLSTGILIPTLLSVVPLMGAWAADPTPSDAASRAAEPPLVIIIKDHHFTPPELVVPANRKFTITVRNEQVDAADFESNDLNREKLIPAKEEVVMKFQPLDPGTYQYLDNLHRESVATIVAK